MERYVTISILVKPFNEWASISPIAKKGRRKVSCGGTLKKYHNAEEQPYGLIVVSTAPGDPLLRKLTKTILIKEKKPLMNTKDEWGNRNIPRKIEPRERGSQA